MVNWGTDRDVYDLTGAFSYFPESVLTGRLAESWETPDATTIIFKIREGVHWHNKAPMNGRELTAQDIEYITCTVFWGWAAASPHLLRPIRVLSLSYPSNR